MVDLGVINRSSQLFPTELQQGIGSTNSSVSMKNEHIVNVNCGIKTFMLKVNALALAE